MSKDPTLELYAAFRAALTGDAAIAAKCAGRVFSDWSNQDAKTPLIRMQIPTVLPYEEDCGEGAESIINVHVYTTENGPIVCRQIAARVREVLEHATFDLPGHRLRWVEYVSTLDRKDPDSISLQTAIVSLRAFTLANPA